MIRIMMKSGNFFNIPGGPMELQQAINEIEMNRFQDKFVVLKNNNLPVAGFPAREVDNVTVLPDEVAKQVGSQPNASNGTAITPPTPGRD